MTNTVVQGDRMSEAVAVTSFTGTGGVYAEGVTQPHHRG